MNLVRTLLVACVLFSVGAAHAAIRITTNIEDGRKLSGVFTITATCESEHLIQQVEFYLNDKLVATDRSTPYEFVFDTVEYPEGNYSITIIAYADDGSKERTSLDVIVDNQLGLGAKHHTGLGEEALREQKWDNAIVAARVALKADEKYGPAFIVLARAYLGKNVFDEAQRYAEDAVEVDPNNPHAHDVLSQVYLRRALAVRAISEEPELAERREKEAFVGAIQSHRKANDLRLKQLADTPETLSQRLLLMFDLGLFNVARGIVKPLLDKNPSDVELSNKMLYILIRLGELVEAQKLYDAIVKRGIADARTYGMGAVLASLGWQDVKADQLMLEALKLDRKSLFVKLCQAFVLSDRNRVPAVHAVVQDMMDNGYFAPEVYYYQGRVYYEMGEYDASRTAYENALRQNPALTEVHIARALEHIRFARRTTDAKAAERYLRLARNSLEVALAARPESPGALSAMSLAFAFGGQMADAVKFAAAAQVVGSQVAWVQYVAAAVYTKAGKSREARQAMDIAQKVNPEGVAMTVPNLDEAFRYMAKWGRTPVLVAP